jgi:predicted MFS family arabinose efflux permease
VLVAGGLPRCRATAADVGPSWTWIVVASEFLGVNQGLTWSTTVITKIDLVGPRGRGLAMSLNEAAD